MRRGALGSVLLIVLLTSMSLTSLSKPQTLAAENAQTTNVTTSVHLSVNASLCGIGQAFRVSITVEPPPPTHNDSFKEIEAFIIKPDGRIDSFTLTTEPKSYHNYTYDSVWFDYVPDEAGTWKAYAKYKGDSFEDGSIVYLSSRSQTVEFSITNELYPQPTPTKKISVISISTETSASNTSMTVTGRLTDPDSVGIPNGDIALSYARSNDTAWTYFGHCLTDNQGKYSYQWTNPVSGTYALKAEWFGNKAFLEASSTLMVNSVPYENEQAFVQSNSTIAQITYNETVGLSFTVSGEAGTTGFSRVSIPKSFMPEKEDIRVFLDGKQINYELSSTGDSWIISFTYQHSTHQVTINTVADNSESGDTILGINYWTWITAIIVIIALVGASGLIAWLVKTRKN